MTTREKPPTLKRALRDSDAALYELSTSVRRFLKLDAKFSREGECPDGYVTALGDVKRALAKSKVALRWYLPDAEERKASR